MSTTLYTVDPVTRFSAAGYDIVQAGTVVPEGVVWAIQSAAAGAGVTLNTSAGGAPQLVQVPSYYNGGTGAPVGDSLPVGAEVRDSTGAPFEKTPSGWVAAGTSVPSQTGNSGKVLGTDGTALSWVANGSGGLALTDVAATASTSGALTVGKHNPVDASTAARAMTLANASAAGKQISVEKTDSTTNRVTVTLNLRGSSGATLNLVWQNESILLEGKADGSWWPVAGHKTKASLDAAYLPFEVTTLNDTFDRTDGLLGNDPRSGYLWLGSGASIPAISGNKMVSPANSSTSYGTVALARPPVAMSGVISFVPGGGTDATPNAMVAASSSVASSSPWTLVHPQFTQSGYQIQKAISNTFTTLASGSWTTPIPIDGTQKTVSWRLAGTTLTLTGPNGEIVSVTDPDLATCNGRYLFFSIEPQDANSPIGRWHRCTASELRSANPEANPRPSDLWLPLNGVAASFDRMLSTNSNLSALTSGTMYCSGLVLPGGVPINWVAFGSSGTAAVSPTHQWAVLLDQEGRVLAVSADKTTEAWPTSTAKQFFFTSQYTPAGPMPVWAGLVVVATTVPTLAGPGTGAATWGSYRPNACGPGSSGQSTPPAVGAFLNKPGAPTGGYPYAVVG